MARTSYLLYRDHFQGAKTYSSGGSTGSRKTKSNLDGKYYQVKSSILDAEWQRKLKADGVDRENFAEIIASGIGRALMNSETQLVPEVYLVYDADRRSILAASRYLENVEGGALTDYAIKFRGRSTNTRFIRIVTKNPITSKQFNIGGNEDLVLRQDLAKGIALSALIRDHDLNPGNMIVTKDNKMQIRNVRIDFGHAFNDLVSSSVVFGGGIRNKNNWILDFLNRETVSHLYPWRRVSKLWNYYEGMVPSQELIDAFKDLASSPNLGKGIAESKQSFMQLAQELEKDHFNTKSVLEHVKKSLIAISNNINSKRISASLPASTVIAQVFNNIHEDCTKGQQQMQDVAQLMQMQIDIDKVILDRKNNKFISQSRIDEIKIQYKKMMIAKGIGLKHNAGIIWVKMIKEKLAFKGVLKEYIRARSKALGMDINASRALTNETFALPARPNIFLRFLRLLFRITLNAIETSKAITGPVSITHPEFNKNDLAILTSTKAARKISVAMSQKVVALTIESKNTRSKEENLEKVAISIGESMKGRGVYLEVMQKPQKIQNFKSNLKAVARKLKKLIKEPSNKQKAKVTPKSRIASTQVL